MNITITFVDVDGNVVVSIPTDAPDHWEACEHGHRVLVSGEYPEANDFQVTETQAELEEFLRNRST